MHIHKTYSKDGKSLNIFVTGAFDFGVVKEFRDAYINENENGNLNECVIDFREADYIDSSGLGMLLNLKRHFNDDVPISLKNCKSQIKKILLISRFDKKFQIH